jgi:predicted HAD superfamily Cof-like phosphohydrolase
MKDTLKFFQIAKPNPTKRDFYTQYSVHIEEFMESIEAIGGKGSPLHEELQASVEQLRDDATNQPEDKIEAAYASTDRVAMLDSLCDQYVTLIGTARALGMDIEGAIKEVEASNLSKFIHVGNRELDNFDFTKFEQQCTVILLEGRYKGVHWKRVGEYIVFYDGNGKILKSPSTYFEPNLEKYA